MTAAGSTATPARTRGVRLRADAAARVALPLLALPLAWIVLANGWAPPMYVGDLPFASPVLAVFVIVGWVAAYGLPPLLLAASRRDPPRAWRIAVAAVIAIYAAMVVRPVAHLLFAARDYVAYGQVPRDMPGQAAAGWKRLNADPDPEAAARRALRWGDTRIFVVEGIGLAPPGLGWSPYAAARFGSRLMPGFSDVGAADSRVAAFRAAAACWTFRYDAELARHLDDARSPRYLAVQRTDLCSRPAR